MHHSICLKGNAGTLRCAQGDDPSTLSSSFRYTTLERLPQNARKVFQDSFHVRAVPVNVPAASAAEEFRIDFVHFWFDEIAHLFLRHGSDGTVADRAAGPQAGGWIERELRDHLTQLFRRLLA